MADRSKIEWTDATWNPIVGCSVVSPGCTNCYAMKTAARFNNMPLSVYHGLTKTVNGNAVWTGEIGENPNALTAPLHWRRPRRIFVNSMGDVFHENATDEMIDRVFAVMALCQQHTFQILSKRAERMRRWFNTSGQEERRDDVAAHCFAIAGDLPLVHAETRFTDEDCIIEPWEWPLPNVHLGVSVEDQERADERIQHLLNTPAAVRFVSAEPLLSEIDFNNIDRGGGAMYDALRGGGFHRTQRFDPNRNQWDWRGTRLNWVIVGGESGPNARMCDVAWIRSIIAQCKAAGVACFVKQLGTFVVSIEDDDFASMGDTDRGWRANLRDPKGGDPSEWPADLRVREWPQ